jgi:predicted acyl esterase
MKGLPDGPVELVFDLLPTAQQFATGHRIRVTITGADKDSYQTPWRQLSRYSETASVPLAWSYRS